MCVSPAMPPMSTQKSGPLCLKGLTPRKGLKSYPVFMGTYTLLLLSLVPDICRLPPEVGPCDALLKRWYYNPQTRRCETFNYGGCRGNANNFKTVEECQRRCAGQGEAPRPEPSFLLNDPGIMGGFSDHGIHLTTVLNSPGGR